MKKDTHNLSKTEVIEAVPLACSNELAAVEFFEKQRWGNTPACVHCGSVAVYKMMDASGQNRSERFLWRCRDCGKQYTVRIGTVYEETRLELRHWCYAFWRAASSKKGVAALEIMRHCQISYKSALFLMNRIRFAMAPDPDRPKLIGTVEADETYIGGKPRPGTGIKHKAGRGTSKTPVFAVVQRNGEKRSRVIADVTSATLRQALREEVDQRARVITDDFPSYTGLDVRFRKHETICHSTKEYSRGDVSTNTVESSFALIKRGITGIYHNVSTEYLHRYLWHFDFLWNNRQLNDGERLESAIKSAEGKRLMYRSPAA
jgi:transposase-like protein